MGKSIVVLTGAGVSQESGISTFRDQNGLWENYRLEEVATPEAFARNPSLVHRFYNQRRAQLKEVEPNDAHFALARLEEEWAGDFLLVSQNVDDLHLRAGSRKLIPMHGELRKARCVHCEWEGSWLEDLELASQCPSCSKSHGLRPHIVWFGETPLGLDEIFRALSKAELFLCIGTSGQVYPAAGFVSHIPQGARKIECNAVETQISRNFSETRQGSATKTVPALVAELLETL